MLVDARELAPSSEVHTDVCIVGAGAAGIALALELRGSGLHVCVVESGGRRRSSRVERLKDLDQRGAYALRQSSWRRLGGATTRWGGNSAPYDPDDFRRPPRPGEPAWPIRAEELERLHPRVQALLGLDTAGYDLEAWRHASRDVRERFIPLEEHGVGAKLYQHGVVDFAERYGAELETRAPDVQVLLHATALRLAASADGGRVERVEVGCLEGPRFAVRARAVVLAAGIQNARILLLSDAPDPRGLGNTHDNLGRHFVTHLNFFSGILAAVAPRRDLSLYGLPEDLGEHEVRHTRVFAGFQVDPARRARENLLGYVAWVAPLSARVIGKAPHLLAEAQRAGAPAPAPQPRILELAEKAAGALLGPRARRRFPRRATAYAVRNWVEQAADRENRIELAEERDELGLRRLRTCWSIGPADKRTIIRSQAILAHALARAGVGHLTIDLPPAEEPWPAHLAENSHYMGSTRMSADPGEGVVDPQCRVHGVSNLYVAGGSVLPRAGVMMVTYNLLALALRLGDHLKRTLR